MTVEEACEFLHDTYEEAARSAGWVTQEKSRVPWDDLPIANKVTMRVAVANLMRELGVTPDPEPDDAAPAGES